MCYRQAGRVSCLRFLFLSKDNSMYLVCITEHVTTSPGTPEEETQTPFYRWVGCGLGSVPFQTEEEAVAEYKLRIKHEWSKACTNPLALTPPEWVDTEEDEFHYKAMWSTLTERINVSVSIHKLETV